MIYVGQCGRQNFSQMARDSSGRAFFDLMVRDVIEGPWEDKLSNKTGICAVRLANAPCASEHILASLWLRRTRRPYSILSKVSLGLGRGMPAVPPARLQNATEWTGSLHRRNPPMRANSVHAHALPSLQADLLSLRLFGTLTSLPSGRCARTRNACRGFARFR
jgi:hypothetical protein